MTYDKSTLDQCNLQYFANLFTTEQSKENVLENNLFIYINSVKNLQEDFKVWFNDLLNIEIPE